MFWRIKKLIDDQFFELIYNTANFITVFRCLGIIKTHKALHKCKKMMITRNKKSENLGIVWYCKFCAKIYSILVDSEFHNLRFVFQIILKFAFFQRNNF